MCDGADQWWQGLARANNPEAALVVARALQKDGQLDAARPWLALVAVSGSQHAREVLKELLDMQVRPNGVLDAATRRVAADDRWLEGPRRPESAWSTWLGRAPASANSLRRLCRCSSVSESLSSRPCRDIQTASTFSAICCTSMRAKASSSAASARAASCTVLLPETRKTWLPGGISSSRSFDSARRCVLA
jgi:hypothetical protein